MRPSLKLWLVTCFGLGLLLIGTSFLFKLHRPTPPVSPPPTESPAIPTPSVTIKDRTLSVEVADTPEKQRQGLGGHKPLTDTEGMLFPYDPPQPVTFWMKGMTFPIDIIYITDDRIVQIYANVPPPQPGTADSNLTRYPSNQPIEYVLETRAGWTQDYQIIVGDEVTLRL